MTDLPYTRSGRYGRATLDQAACGKGYVVSYKAAAWVISAYGDKSCWNTFQELHTALAYLCALTGPEVQRISEGAGVGGAVKRSRSTHAASQILSRV